MTDFPDVKLKALVSFPGNVNGGTAIDVSKANGIYSIDLDVSELQRNASITPEQVANSWMTIWNEHTDTYEIVPYALAATSGVASIGGKTGALDIGPGLGFDGTILSNKATVASRAVVPSIAIPAAFNYIMTQGYATPGDGGAALYKRIGSAPTHVGKVQSADGAWWVIAESVLDVLMFGASKEFPASPATQIANRTILQNVITCCDALGGGQIVVPWPVDYGWRRRGDGSGNTHRADFSGCVNDMVLRDCGVGSTFDDDPDLPPANGGGRPKDGMGDRITYNTVSNGTAGPPDNEPVGFHDGNQFTVAANWHCTFTLEHLKHIEEVGNPARHPSDNLRLSHIFAHEGRIVWQNGMLGRVGKDVPVDEMYHYTMSAWRADQTDTRFTPLLINYISGAINFSSGASATEASVWIKHEPLVRILFPDKPTLLVDNGMGDALLKMRNSILLLSAATPVVAGTGYAVGNILTVVGGLAQAGAATLTVSSVSGGGVTGVTVTTNGPYFQAPPSPAPVTGGAGTGATFNLAFAPPVDLLLTNSNGTLKCDNAIAARASGSRPTSPPVGSQMYDTSLGIPIWFAGGGVWRNAAGVAV